MKLSSEQIAKAEAMRRNRVPVSRIAALFGCHVDTVLRAIDQDYGTMLRWRDRQAPSRQRHGVRERRDSFRPTEEEFRCAQKLIPPEHTDLTASFFGDPRPGRSALDRKQAEART